MLHPYLQFQFNDYINKTGCICPDNLEEFLNLISNAYYGFEQQEHILQSRIIYSRTPDLSEIHKSYEKLQEVIFAIDVSNYSLIFINPACETMYGYPIQDFYTNPSLWFELVVEEDRQYILDNNAVLNRGETLVQNYRIRRKNGEVRWLQSRMEPTLSDEGILIRIDGIALDITDQKNAEMALINSEKKFRLLIENTIDMITVANEAMEFTFVSKSVYALTGFTEEEIIGRKIFDFFHPDDVTWIKEKTTDILGYPGEPHAFIIRFLKKDGTWLKVEGVVTNMLHEPAVNGFVTNFHDITEKVERQEALNA